MQMGSSLVGSSLVGSTHAESACLRSHALLLLSKLQGRGREDMEGGVGGLLKGLCSYLNVQGHSGSNMTKSLDDEVMTKGLE